MQSRAYDSGYETVELFNDVEEYGMYDSVFNGISSLSSAGFSYDITENNSLGHTENVRNPPRAEVHCFWDLANKPYDFRSRTMKRVMLNIRYVYSTVVLSLIFHQ